MTSDNVLPFRDPNDPIELSDQELAELEEQSAAEFQDRGPEGHWSLLR